MSALRLAVADGLIISWRNLKRIPRIPELAIFAILQSIMFVLLFAFVFGGAIPLPGGGSYREFLMPGIFVQTLAFASITTAIAVADDMTKGLIDRFRSLPMARSAVLSGRTFADILYNAGILIVLMVSGLVVGWRVNNGFGDFVAAVALLLFFTYAMAWIGVFLGLVVPTVEVAQQLGFLIIFPLTFVSNAFVPTETLPGVLQPIAEWNPVSALTGATRELFGNPNPFVNGSFPGQHPIFMSIVWTIVLLAVFAPLAIQQVPRNRPLTARGASNRSLRVHRLAWISTFLRARALPRHGPWLRRRPGRPVAEELDREARFPYELVAEMADLGLMGIPFPEELGGAGGDTLSYAIAIEELARIDSSVAITVAAHTSLGTMPIYLFGSDEQKRDWIPPLASGEKLAAFGLTEPGAGSDAGATRTTAALRDDSWVVDGAKVFITNAGTDITQCVTITALTARTRSRTSCRERYARLRDLGADAQDGLEGVRHSHSRVHGLRCPRGQPPRHARRGLQPVPEDPRRWPHLGRRDERRRRAGRV